MDFRVREAKRLTKLKIHQDGFKPTSSLEWQSAVTSVRWGQMSTWWSNRKKNLRLPKTISLHINENLPLMGLYRRHALQHKVCLVFHCIDKAHNKEMKRPSNGVIVRFSWELLEVKVRKHEIDLLCEDKSACCMKSHPKRGAVAYYGRE